MDLVTWCKQDLSCLSLMDNIDQAHHARVLYESQRKLLCTLLDIDDALEVLEPKGESDGDDTEDEENANDSKEDRRNASDHVSAQLTAAEERARAMLTRAWLRFGVNARISAESSGPAPLPLFQSLARFSERNEDARTHITGQEWENKTEGANVRAAAVAAGVPKAMTVGLLELESASGRGSDCFSNQPADPNGYSPRYSPLTHTRLSPSLPLSLSLSLSTQRRSPT